MTTTSNGRLSLALLLGFLVPGAGHFVYGRRDKGLFFFALVLAAFLAGLWLGEFRCIHAEKFQIYLFAQIWNGLPTLAALALTSGLRQTQDIAYLDAGLLYTSVAGLLNIVVMVDVYEIHCKRAAAGAAPPAVAAAAASAAAQGAPRADVRR